MNKPKIRDLQDFTKQYFRDRCPVVRWKRMKRFAGLAQRKRNLVYLNPNISLDRWGCPVWCLNYQPRKIKMNEGEQYFLVLLHEIGHFKVKKQVPKKYHLIKKKIIKDLKEDQRLQEKTFGKRKEKSWENIDLQCYVAEDYFERRKGESSEEFDGRTTDFQTWLTGNWASKHFSVEDWAIQEFKKQRKKIRKILRG